MTLTRYDRLALAILWAAMAWLTLTGCTPRQPIRVECDIRRFEDARRDQLEELAGYEGWTGESRADARLAMPWWGRE